MWTTLLTVTSKSVFMDVFRGNKNGNLNKCLLENSVVFIVSS
uniref:Uncharacterized protein n=1 Tax=Arundo donax TaxID=35708 RepID=A0A0A9FG83_ARUDO